ncbi:MULTISPECIES: MFS transporter [unclassified Arthrobacter]|uniref:MFS transporter n=1 Tax=unclassified Arthrobacter TaxID=235627 RepID=UPI002157A1E3|nr:MULTISPECIES: MFS transporter [unclassified Arthrobacter]
MSKPPAAATKQVPDSALRFVGFLSFFDRYATPPMFLALSLATALTLSQAVELVAGYSLLYALGQPLWGLASDRLGRLTVLRCALFGVVLGAIASSVFTEFFPLLIARSFTGFMFGALYPTLLTLLGDTRVGLAKARGLSDLQIYSSLGTTLATLVAGALATFVDWRLVFLLPALGAIAALATLRRVAEPLREATARNFKAAFGAENLLLYAAVFLEGGLLMGMLAYVVPALQDAGVGIWISGLLGCGFAGGVIFGARLMRLLVSRFSRTWLIGIGGVVLWASFAPSAFAPSPAAFTCTAFLLGVANAVMHSSMQGWATEVAPQARATTVSLFVFSLFFGASAATYLTADLAEQGNFSRIFGIGFWLSIVLVVAATWLHARWLARQLA